MSITPANNATNVATSGTIVITFSEAMDNYAYVELGKVSVVETLPLTNARWSNGNKTYSIDYSGLEGGTEYYLYSERDGGYGGKLIL